MEKYGVWCVSSAGWCYLSPKCPTNTSVNGLSGSRSQALNELKSFSKEYPDNKYVLALHNEQCSCESIVETKCCEPIFVEEK
jgi:hypothetical protein